MSLATEAMRLAVQKALDSIHGEHFRREMRVSFIAHDPKRRFDRSVFITTGESSDVVGAIMHLDPAAGGAVADEAYRAGAEAMRKACMRECRSHGDQQEGTVAWSCDLLWHLLRDLPAPKRPGSK